MATLSHRQVISSFLVARKGWVRSVGESGGPVDDDLRLFFPFRLVWETV